MRISRAIAIGVIVASSGLTGLSAVQAQNLRNAQPPAEFPPSSYQGKQYVDSRGCIYIRAGVDGNITWVPRVSRDRKQVCGYKPSLGGQQVAAAAPPRPSAKPTLITVEPSPSAATVTAPKPAAAPAPRQSAAPRRTVSAPAPARTPSAAPKPTVYSNPSPAPARTATASPPSPFAPLFGLGSGRKPSPGPEPTLYVNPPPRSETPRAPSAAPRVVTTAPAARTARPSPAPEPTVFSNPAPAPKRTATRPATPPQIVRNPAPQAGGCPNASPFSQQFINKSGRYKVRCGPQAESPVTVRPARQNSSAAPVLAPRQTAPSAPLTDDTRILARHIYDQRQNTVVGMIPEGYRRVWDDGRLNPRRAERTPKPAVDRRPVVPPGYRVAWDDERLNRNRAGGTARGQAQMAMIWSDTVPRKLIAVPTDRPVVTLPNNRVSAAPAPQQSLFRISSRSAPETTAKAARPTYVRVATYGSDAEARQTAQALARTGLPMRLGSVKRRGSTQRVVLAGPFPSEDAAQAALSRVRQAGFRSARLN